MKEFKFREVYVVLDGPADPASTDPIYSNVYANRDDAVSCIDVLMALSDLRERSMSIWRLQVNDLCTEQDVREVVRDLVARGSDGPFMRYALREDSHAFLEEVQAIPA